MIEQSTHWLRDLLLVPLIVGLVTALFVFILPKFLDRPNQLSYSIEGPNRTVKVDYHQVTTCFMYQVRIWNSGTSPLHNVPVRFVFTALNKGFKFETWSRHTKPAFEFGKITEDSIDNTSKRFVYELLNPDDEDNIILLATDSVQLYLFAKIEALNFKEEKPKESKWRWAEISLTTFSVLVSFITSLLFMYKVNDKLITWLKRMLRKHRN